jgi:peptidyl-prolyl cis-trans isomerase SurA
MILKKIIFILFVITLNFNFYKLQAIENKILFKIDNEIITSIDIYNQTKYLKSLNQEIQNLSEQDIFEISKKTIIKEKIKKTELLKNNIKLNLDDKVLNPFIRSVFKPLNINNLNEYKDFINLLDLNFEPMKEKLIIEILWNNLIFKKFSSKIKINKDDLQKEIFNNKNTKQTTYLLNEILFSSTNKLEIESKYKIIKDSIKKKGFKNTALVHSIADSSKNGGSLGWVNKNSLNKKIIEKLSVLKENEYSDPILTPGGFLILMIEDKKEIEKKIDLEKELNDLIRINTNQQLSQFSAMHLNRVMMDVSINEL